MNAVNQRATSRPARLDPPSDISLGTAPPGKRFFDQFEAAAYIGVAQRTLARWRVGIDRDYEIPYSKVGRLIRYDRADLDAYMTRRRFVNPDRRARRGLPNR